MGNVEVANALRWPTDKQTIGRKKGLECTLTGNSRNAFLQLLSVCAMRSLVVPLTPTLFAHTKIRVAPTRTEKSK